MFRFKRSHSADIVQHTASSRYRAATPGKTKCEAERGRSPTVNVDTAKSAGRISRSTPTVHKEATALEQHHEQEVMPDQQQQKVLPESNMVVNEKMSSYPSNVQHIELNNKNRDIETRKRSGRSHSVDLERPHQSKVFSNQQLPNIDFFDEAGVADTDFPRKLPSMNLRRSISTRENAGRWPTRQERGQQRGPTSPTISPHRQWDNVIFQYDKAMPRVDNSPVPTSLDTSRNKSRSEPNLGLSPKSILKKELGAKTSMQLQRVKFFDRPLERRISRRASSVVRC